MCLGFFGFLGNLVLEWVLSGIFFGVVSLRAVFFEKRRGNPLKFFWGVGFGGGLGVLRGFWGIFVFYGWAWGFLVGFWGGLWIATPFL